MSRWIISAACAIARALEEQAVATARPGPNRPKVSAIKSTVVEHSWNRVGRARIRPRLIKVVRKFSLSQDPPTEVPNTIPHCSGAAATSNRASASASRAASQPNLSLRELRNGTPKAVSSRRISPVTT